MNGQHVRLHVEVEHGLKLGLVQILLPNTVEMTVLVLLQRVRAATLTYVQVRLIRTSVLSNIMMIFKKIILVAFFIIK